MDGRAYRLLPVLVAALAAGCHGAPERYDWSRLRWTEQASGVTAGLRGVSAVDARTCWASGSGGTWLRTTDGGATWTAGVVPGAEERDFRDVEAFDADRALLMAVASPAEFWLTQDGGVTWRLAWRLDHPDVFLDAMDFWDHRRGLAWGDPIDGSFCVLTTETGGRSWSRVPADRLPEPFEGEAGFAASGTCVAVGARGRAWIATGGSHARVLRTEDWGATWTTHDTPMLAGEPSNGGFSIVMLDDGRGALVGGDYANPDTRAGSAAYTTDDGRTWTLCSGELPGYRSCVAEVGSGFLLAVSKAGVSSSEGGREWMPLEGPALYALDVVREERTVARGWGTGAGGQVVRFDF